METIFNPTGHEYKFPNMVKAENCYLFDSDGSRYLDLESGVWCTPLGQCHPEVVRTIAE